MTRTQIQLPDTLYRQAKALAAAREVSLAELVRNGLEYVLRVYAAPDASNLEWKMPETFALGADDPFIDPEWRTKLHCECVADAKAHYQTTKIQKRLSK